MIKVDIRKAFDSLQWDFVANMFSGFGFPKQFTDWVLGCIQSPWYSLKLNGELSGFFQGNSGIRQGDPLSPYLFLLSMEVLSRYLRKHCDQPLVSYHPKCSRLNLNHLIFDDDLMIFTRRDVPSVEAVKLILNQFAGLYGLHANTAMS
ncbi:secreted RxLR effector protein 78-like [Silene latifolia]|uniref:secreted RxLR effector protein 78-like n=1 Tax=Silene latifolia TaxID=37657 RepID=UPI003D77A712